MKKIMLSDVRENKEIRVYMERGNDVLCAKGYTEHSFIHSELCAKNAAKILEELGFSEREQELAKIAGFMHDIGNVVNREDHAHNGAIIAFTLLSSMGMEAEEIATVVSAIGNHDEKTGTPVSPVSAALILADKSDVRRSRVRSRDVASFDIHDRVNYSATESQVICDKKNGKIKLCLCVDTEHSTISEYFEIFLERMLMCRKAAEFLKMRFALEINGTKLM